MIDRRGLPGLGTAAAAAPLGSAGAAGASSRQIQPDQALAVEDYARLGDGAGPVIGRGYQAGVAPCAFDPPVPRLTPDAATRPG